MMCVVSGMIPNSANLLKSDPIDTFESSSFASDVYSKHSKSVFTPSYTKVVSLNLNVTPFVDDIEFPLKKNFMKFLYASLTRALSNQSDGTYSLPKSEMLASTYILETDVHPANSDEV